MKFRRLSVLLATGLLAAVLSPAAAHDGRPDHKGVRVMTRNMYFGADLLPVITAPTAEAS